MPASPSDTSSVDPRASDREAASMAPIHRRGDRWIGAFIAGHLLLAFALAPTNGTWRQAGIVGGGLTLLFAASAWRWPGSLWTRCLAGLALQGFAALHIYQMRGLEEMHFFVFTGATLMIVYQDVVGLWPGVVGIVAQHTLFSFWHNLGHPIGGMPFFEHAHVPGAKLAFHFGIAVLQVSIASCWAIALRRRTLAGARQADELRAANDALRRSGAAAARSVSLLEATLDATADGILVLDDRDRITDGNRRFAELWGLPESMLTAEHSATVLAHVERQLLDPAALVTRASPASCDRSHVDRLALTGGRVFERVVRPLRVDGDVVGRVLSYRDVTAEHQAQSALAASEARFRAVFDHAGLGIIFCDDAGRVVETNRATQELLRMTADELRGRPSSALSPPDEVEVTREPIRKLKAGLRDHVTIEKRFTRGDGSEIVGALTVSLVETPQARGTVGMLQDVTERRELERQLVRQALTDPLTGLANRVLFRDRVSHAVVRASRDDGRLAVLLVDLDGFKLVNDGLGHVAGDAVLAAVGARLRDVVRDGDTVARLGGDEFAILLETLRAPEEADATAARVLDALRAPVAVTVQPGDAARTEVFVAASIGVAVAALGDAPDALIRNADVAMYAAKARGKGQAARYEAAMHDRALARLRLEADLRAAIAELDAAPHAAPFHLVFQPIVGLHDQRVTGAEALLRWTHAERGLVTPAEFIPVAEDTGAIVALGRWVLREACAEAARWPAIDGVAPSVCVNLSGRQLQEESLVDDVRAALAESGLPAPRLTLEITESVVMRDTALALDRLAALKAIGVRLAVDDFGTGYSSLAYLQQFPVDVLKIDKSFVDDVARSDDAAALARTIVALADMLGLRTVAEGVEDGAQLAALEAIGCALGQGYLFARPLSAEALRARLAAVPVGAVPVGAGR